MASFTSNRQSGCAPLGVSFRDQSSNSPKYWSWDFGNGEFSNLQNPSITYAQPGTYTVTLTVRNGDGTNAITRTNYITVNTSPTANFTISSNIACAPSAITFTDRSVPNSSPITDWYWDFGDGTTSTAQNPIKTYTDPGFYTVSLRITSATGCQASRTMARAVRITSGVTAEFSASQPATCRPPFNIDFTNQTSGPGTLTYQWNFGNSTSSTQPDPLGTYTAPGTYNVTLTARSQYGCSKSITKPVTIGTVPVNFTGPDTACLSTPVSFTEASGASPISSFWDLGNGATSDQATATSTYTTAGIYNIKLVNTYGSCKDSITKPLVIIADPAVDFTATGTTGCRAPHTTVFQAAAPEAVSWRWDFGDGSSSTVANPSHTYTTEGNFNVTLTITNRNGCTNTITKPAVVSIRKPQIRFTNAPTGGCVPFNFAARANVVAPDGVASYAWDYGNGQTRTGATPTIVTYTTEGRFTLTLTVTTNGGCTQTLAVPEAVITGSRKTADFSTNTADTCASSLVEFNNLSTGTDEWLWDFGDGNTSTLQHPRHRFADTGNFNVVLISYYQKCPSLRVTKVVHNKPPLAGLRFVRDCTTGGTFTFLNTSKTDIAYGPIDYTWKFGDPSIPDQTSATPTPVTFPGTGPYTVSLTVTNGGCTHKASALLRIADEQADFRVSPVPACINKPITLEAINSDPANVVQYQWTVNGVPLASSNSTETVSLPAPGSYNVRLRITDINNCSDIETKNNVIVVTGPQARFTPATRGECRNRDITFRDQTTSAVRVVEWIFDFGDGTTKSFTAPPFTHRYADTGLYTVQLTAVDNNGCRGTFTSTETIHITGPSIGFKSDYTTICPRTNVQFTDTTTGNILSYRWSFGDGGTSTLQNPVHAFAGTDGATFRIRLEVTDASGCTDSVVRNDYVILKTPKPAFDIEDSTTICPPLETKFFNKSADYESFYFDFGDGGSSSLDDPSHFYNLFGTYTAKLYTFGIGGCLDSASRTIRVLDPARETNIGYSRIGACDSLTVDFNITTPAFTRFTFFYGDGASDNTQSRALRHLYNTPNNYRPSLVLTDRIGCQVTVGGSQTIRILGAEVIFGMDKKRFCDNGEIFFTDFTRPRQDPILSRTWDFGDGVTSTDLNPSHVYVQPGTFYPKLTAVTDFGCNSTMTDTVRVFRTPEPVIVGDDIICLNNELTLNARLVTPDTAISWKWEPGAGGAASTASSIRVKYGQTGTYSIRLEAANLLGCKSDTTKQVQVPALPEITIAEDPVIPLGTSITLPVTYTGDIVSWNWIPATSLSCDDCPNPVANPKYTTKYMIQVTDENGCMNTRGITVNVQCNDKNYFVPNTFSPNNDGRNDRFYPRGSSITRISSMKIFNRWGEQLFERRNFSANDPAAGWDGTIKGKPANPDVYIYVVEFICENAAIVPFRGNVMLVR